MKYLAYFLVLIFLSSCAPAFLGVGAGVGIAGYKYVSGTLSVEYVADYDKVWEATFNSLKELDIKIEKIEKDALNGYIKGKKADGKIVVVKLKNKPSNIVEVKIKVGIFGDEEASKIIKKAIDTELGIQGE